MKIIKDRERLNFCKVELKNFTFVYKNIPNFNHKRDGMRQLIVVRMVTQLVRNKLSDGTKA